MEYAVIFILTSMWDGRPLEVKTVGVYDNKETCEIVAKKINEIENTNQFFCVPDDDTVENE